MHIGIILHGPEIIDAGSAKKIIDIFRQENEVTAKLGGTMGRTAVLDAGLEDIIDISQGLTPSETILALNGSIDIAILLNHGKTLETGRYFGRFVASKLKSSSIPFVHIERPDCEGRIIYYSQQAKKCAEYVRKTLTKYGENYSLPVEKDSPLPPYIRTEGRTLIRRISGAFPGENIRLDGIVVGTVTHPEPEIVCQNGKVVKLLGVDIKQHGLEKLENRNIDLFKARVKTGNIRRTKHKSRIKTVPGSTSLKTVAIIDHCAESTFELIKDAGLVITVGDDTTTITADILVRLGIPIIGIVDGDPDHILEDPLVPKGSVIIRVREGFDDILGREVFEKLMGGKQKIYRQRSDELFDRILALAGKKVVNIKYY
ncbi:MAG TPA: DUF2117 domain-containing protein [Candidatus Methanoperedens sp.]